MSPRASLPGAAELFRSTGTSGRVPAEAPAIAPAESPAPLQPDPAPALSAVRNPAPAEDAALDAAPRRTSVRQSARRVRQVADRAPTGRERHEEKITVYCSAEELIDLETARLTLRAEHGMAVDRGRIVREAMAVVLADLEAKGEASILVRRLREA
jgi:hypothetical protein